MRFVHRRRAVVAASGGVAALLAAASLAWACTSIDGLTWYSDGSYAKSGSSGTLVTVYATGAITNRNYYMISGTADGHGHSCIGTWVKENPNARLSTSTGQIPNTSGTIDRTSGTWDVCFVTTDIDTTHPTSITSPVSFQVL